MKKVFFSFLFLLGVCTVLFQNCGSYKPVSRNLVDEAPVGLSSQYESLTVRNAEFTTFIDNNNEFFRKFTVTFGQDRAFVAQNESGVCTRAFSLDLIDSLALRSFLESATYRDSGVNFTNGNQLASTLFVEGPNGPIVDGFAVPPQFENSVPPGRKVLNEYDDFEKIIDYLTNSPFSDEQESCLVDGEVPQFVEYRYVDQVNGVSQVVGNEAFLLENQSTLSFLGFASGANNCYEYFELNLQERAFVLKSVTAVQTFVRQADPNGVNNGTGTRTINYEYPNQMAVTTYFIDETIAPVQLTVTILTNGEDLTNNVLMIAEKARQRYQDEGRLPVAWLNGNNQPLCVFRQ